MIDAARLAEHVQLANEKRESHVLRSLRERTAELAEAEMQISVPPWPVSGPPLAGRSRAMARPTATCDPSSCLVSLVSTCCVARDAEPGGDWSHSSPSAR
jgi:hypothetical protein